VIVSLTKTKPPARFGRLAAEAMKGSGLGLGFVVVLVAQSYAVIVVFDLVIVRSKKKFTQRNSFGLPITALKVLQPSLLCEPS
jgi:hypothetical protein